MDLTDEQQADRLRKHATLIRLANSCERAAARGSSVVPMAPDLDQEDYKVIAQLLRGLAGTMIDPDGAALPR